MTEPEGEMSGARPRSSRAAIIAVVLVLVVGAALRVGLNNVTEYSPADEQVYVELSSWLIANGWGQFPILCQNYLDHPDLWDYPDPLRWGYLGLASLTCRAAGHCDPRALSWLSTAAGVLSLLLTFLLGRELLGE